MDFFDFPKEYKNEKSFGKDRYLRYANLTPREYDFLNRHLLDIQVEYQLPCKDRVQVMIFTVEVDTLRSNELSDLCGVLSRSTWRPSLFLLWHGDHGKICTAIKEDGPNGRGKVLSQISTRLFRISNPDPYVYNVLNHLNIPFRDYTSEELIQEWFDAIELVAGVHAAPLVEEDGVIYRVEGEAKALSEGQDTVLTTHFALWYNDTIVPILQERSLENLSEFVNVDILADDFSIAAREVLQEYIEKRQQYDVSDEDGEDLYDEEDKEESFFSYLEQLDLETWRQSYLEACFRYTSEYLNAILPYQALGAVYEEIHGDADTWPEGTPSIVEVELLTLVVEQV